MFAGLCRKFRGSVFIMNQQTSQDQPDELRHDEEINSEKYKGGVRVRQTKKY